MEDGSDSIVKSGRHGYVTLERDGQTLYAVVNNYADLAVPLENSFVISVHGDFDVTKVSVEIYRGITLGMSEETMKALLGDNVYETEELDNGVSYFIYADEAKQNYTRIFVDKDLKLVREIELSNSPDTLLRRPSVRQRKSRTAWMPRRCTGMTIFPVTQAKNKEQR